MDLSIGDVIQGGCGTVALYLAFQIKYKLTNHENRISKLESARASAHNRKRRNSHTGRRRTGVV